MTGMSKAERTELRSIVRGQFKVLRSEIEQREIELRADVQQQIADKYADEDAVWEAINEEVRTILADANKAVHDVLYRHEVRAKNGSEEVLIGLARQIREKPDEKNRQALLRLGYTRLAARVKAATVELDRKEADLLRDLAVGALESDAAQAFLSSIPAVGDLVPAARLAELEASLREDS